MILITLGTQKQQFTRILQAVEDSKIEDEIIVQAGYTKFVSKKMKIFDFIPYDKMSKLIKKSNIVITHGGTGSIIMPLKEGKCIIACPRLQKYGEHVDDHQLQITEIFSDEGYILTYNDGDKMDDIYKKCLTFKPRIYISNTSNFIEKLKKIIDE